MNIYKIYLNGGKEFIIKSQLNYKMVKKLLTGYFDNIIKITTVIIR